MYSPTPLYGHPLNMDTSLLRTVCFVPEEKSPYIFSKFNPLYTDSSLSVLIKVRLYIDKTHVLET